MGNLTGKVAWCRNEAWKAGGGPLEAVSRDQFVGSHDAERGWTEEVRLGLGVAQWNGGDWSRESWRAGLELLPRQPRYGCSLGLPKRDASWRPGEPVSRPVRIQSPARRLRPALLIFPIPPITPSTCLTFPQLLLRFSFSSQPPARSHQNNNIPLRQHRPLPPFIDIQLHSFSRLPFRNRPA